MHKIVKNTIREISSFLKHNLYTLLHLIYVLLISRIMQVCFNIRDFNYAAVILLFSAGIIIYLFYRKILISNKYRIVFTLLIAFSLFAAYFFYKPFAAFIYSSFSGNMSQVEHEIMLQRYTYFRQFLPLFAVLIPPLTAAAAGFNKKGFEYFIVACTLSFMIFLWYLGYDAEIKIYLYPYVLICLFIWGLDTYSKYISVTTLKGYRVSVDAAFVMKSICFICLSIVLFSFLCVKIFGIKSIPETIVDSVMQNPKIQEVVKKNRYGLQLSGYNSSDYKLGGAIIPDTTVAFRVKSNEPVYLRGTVKISYDGSMWKRQESGLEELYSGPLPDWSGSTPAGGNMQQPPESGGFTRESITIYPENLITSSLFTPLYASEVHMDGGIFSIDGSGNITMRNSTSITKPYTIDYSKSISAFEEFSNGYNLGERIAYLNGDDTGADYQDVRDSYYKYLQVPDSISPRIYSLVNSITSGCNTGSEKVLKIQDYLSKNYEYSLDVPSVPNGEEFLDYFLFTEKKGYCTYFATAYTIFCRIAGIPARYVEGFKMQDKKDSHGLYIVSNDMAHAWTEVLVLPDKNIWSIVDAVPANSDEVLNQYIADMPENTKGPTGTAGSPGIKTGADKAANDSAGGIIFNFMLILLSAMALFILYLLCSVVLYNRKIHNMLLSKSMVPIFLYTKERLLRCKIQSTMIQDDIKWMESISDGEFKARIAGMVSSVYAEYYGNIYGTGFDRLDFYRYLESYIRARENMLEYMALKYPARIDFKELKDCIKHIFHIFYPYLP